MKKTFSTLVLAGTFFISTFAMAADLIQKDGNGRFQAELQNVPLSDVAKFMQTAHGVKFKGDAKIMDSPVTVTFIGLDMEAMLKKILARNNYVFAYDSQGNVTEVRLLAGGGEKNVTGTMTKPGIQPGNQSVGRNQAGSSQVTESVGTMSSPGNEMEDVTQTVDEITSFKVDPNASPDEITSFKADPNKKDNITSFKVDPNSPKDEITAFKTIENSPPPSDENKNGK